MLIGNAARTFLRLTPAAFAEASTHPLAAYDASDEVAAAARQAYVHRLPLIGPRCMVGSHNPSAGTRGRKAVGHGRRRTGRCSPLSHRALVRACPLRRGARHPALMRGCALHRADGRRALTLACRLGRGNRRRAWTNGCPLRHLRAGTGNGYLEVGRCLRFHRRCLHGDRHCGRRCGRRSGGDVLRSDDGFRGDLRRVRRRHIHPVSLVRGDDEDRRDGSHEEAHGPGRAPPRSRRRGGERRLRDRCRDGCLAWCCRRAGGVGRWRPCRHLGCTG